MGVTDAKLEAISTAARRRAERGLLLPKHPWMPMKPERVESIVDELLAARDAIRSVGFVHSGDDEFKCPFCEGVQDGGSHKDGCIVLTVQETR